MTAPKQRLTVTVDPELIGAGNEAVASGRADSMSGWVTTALAEKVSRDAKLAALRDAVADYEAEFGQITADELASQGRADRKTARVVRGTAPRGRSAPRGPSAATP